MTNITFILPVSLFIMAANKKIHDVDTGPLLNSSMAANDKISPGGLSPNRKANAMLQWQCKGSLAQIIDRSGTISK